MNFETPGKVFAVKVTDDHREGHSSNVRASLRWEACIALQFAIYFKDAECRYCKKRGHIAQVCRSKDRRPQQQRHAAAAAAEARACAAEVAFSARPGRRRRRSQTPEEYTVCNLTV